MHGTRQAGPCGSHNSPDLPRSPLPPSLPHLPRHGAEALDLCLTSILGREFGSIRQRSKLNVQVGEAGGLHAPEIQQDEVAPDMSGGVVCVCVFRCQLARSTQQRHMPPRIMHSLARLDMPPCRTSLAPGAAAPGARRLHPGQRGAAGEGSVSVSALPAVARFAPHLVWCPCCSLKPT